MYLQGEPPCKRLSGGVNEIDPDRSTRDNRQNAHWQVFGAAAAESATRGFEYFRVGIHGRLTERQQWVATVEEALCMLIPLRSLLPGSHKGVCVYTMHRFAVLKEYTSEYNRNPNKI